MPPVSVASSKSVASDGTVLVVQNKETNMESPPTAGTSFLLYGMIGFFVVGGIFLICIMADSMGGGLIKIGKRIVLADGSGHSSMLTEILIFILVCVFIGLYFTSVWNSTPPATTATKTSVPLNSTLFSAFS